jgi:membrane dipeptidase
MGITSCNATALKVRDSFSSATLNILGWIENLASLDDIFHATKAEDVRVAKKNGSIALFLGAQNSFQVEDNITYVEALQLLGLRIMGLAYQRRTLLADGCGERTDSGLSEFGVNVVSEMNRVGMLIDLSHVGRASSLDAIEFSQDPVVFSHSNARALREHVRNIDDEQMKALAEKGGVQGVTAFQLTLKPADQPRPTLNDILDHLDYAVNLIGIDHVGIGLDRGLGVKTIDHYEGIKEHYPELRTGMSFERWAAGTEGISEPKNDWNITRGLVHRGYSDQEIYKILGENFLRVFEKVFKG